MTRLVHGRHALVVAHDGAAGHAASGDVAAVAGVDAWAGVEADVGGEGAFTQDAADEVSLHVQVEGGVGAAAKGGLHVCVVGICGANGPCVVGCEVCVLQVEVDVEGIVGCVHCCDLSVYLDLSD